MSSDCIVRLSDTTGNGRVITLYLENKGYLARAGAIVAKAARIAKATNCTLEDLSDYFTVGSGLAFGPISTGGLNLGDVDHHYHIVTYPDINHIEIDYHKLSGDIKSYTVPEFIRKVNKSRKSANYPYKMIAQRETARPFNLVGREQIAQRIIDQMGGLGPLRAMVGGKNFMAVCPAGLKFDFRGHPGVSNKCQVVYNSFSDSYNLEFYYYTRVHFSHCPRVKIYEGIQSERLKSLFTEFTGLNLTL